MNVSETIEGEVEPKSERRRNRRARRRGRSSGRKASSAVGGELRAWAEVIDGLLVAVEETAWSARRLADVAGKAVREGQSEIRSRGNAASVKSDDMARVAQTGWMLTRMAAGYRWHRVEAAFTTREHAERKMEKLHAVNARRFYETSARHGGAFLKVGQLLSARRDLLPEVWIRELAGLQDAAPTIPFEAVRTVIEADFGRPLEEIFASFDAEPIAAASIGQVHRALTTDGKAVAVKVQRPGIGPRIETDLGLLETFVMSLEDSLPDADFDTIIGEVRRAVLAEVDYVAEARTASHVADFLSGHPDLFVPRPLPELCTEHVLTTEFADGEKITVVLDRLAEQAKVGSEVAHGELSRILGLLLEAYLKQVLEAGIFQADPHPGNVLVTKDGRLALLDFGCSESMTDEKRKAYLGLLAAFVVGNREQMADLFHKIGFRTASGKPDTLEAFAGALLTEIRQLALSQDVKWPTREELSKRFSGLLVACQADSVTVIPGEFVMMARVFATLGGLFQSYEPKIDFTRHVLPVLGASMF